MSLASEQPNNDLSSRHSGSPQWPGERHPTRWDVHDANESLASTFLERFKTSLLQSEEARACKSLFPSPEQSPLQAPPLPGGGIAGEFDAVLVGMYIVQTCTNAEHQQDRTRTYTYPMVLLDEVSQIPEENELASLQSSFFTSFKLHTYLDAIDIPDTTQRAYPPYFPLALACLASAVTPKPNMDGTSETEVSAQMFTAGVALWCVVLEVDNREARLLEAVVAASLLSTYGILTADRSKWRKAAGLLSNTATIARRLRLSDSYSPVNAPTVPSDRTLSMQSSLMSYMFLSDVVYAIHCGATPTYSTAELNIKMPSSNHSFRKVYALIHNSAPLPKDMKSREDGLLLLTALLNDTIYIQRCHFMTRSFSSIHAGSDANVDAPLRNPHAPLGSRAELSRRSATMYAALDRWRDHFQQHVGRDVLALYYFGKLQLVCPDTMELPHLAGYISHTTEAMRDRRDGSQANIPDKAMDLAWLVLDNCNLQSEPLGNKLAIWLPATLFHSALVIWQRLRFRSAADAKYGTLKMLNLFKIEITQMPWPCCLEMEATLDRLVKE